MNLLRLVVMPRFIGSSEMSRWMGLPLSRSAILMPKGEREEAWFVSPMKRHAACSMNV